VEIGKAGKTRGDGFAELARNEKGDDGAHVSTYKVRCPCLPPRHNGHAHKGDWLAG
jgi:hypothetical protein